ncbi:hypothetical protein EXIGLDRAFT_91529 [Exidia glandulosa HHB12029]|uniref:Uncharacterized protein n=1 Tax=Exidia glandulosa HHB12029 TaxID=1314781 RepID=A0A165HBF3_EXIGL|nr:hypothetical protein EXIGLDRAFT_91529 [Exidia glandulosa HHB12029]
MALSRSLNAFTIIFYSALVWAGAANGLKNITINDNNARIKYSPANIVAESECKARPDNPECKGNWWIEHQGTTDIHDTFGPNTACEFEFKGSAFYVYGVTLDYGANGFFSLDDGAPEQVSFHSPNQGPNHGVLIWAKTGLDATQTHTFHLTYDNSSFGVNRYWLGIDYFQYTVADDSQDLTDVL